MTHFEYKVIPAPKKGLRGKGVKGTDGKFANALTTVMNDMAADGWQYQRSDTLPLEERSGLTGKTTTYMNMLVFRRETELKEEKSDTPVLAIAAPVIENTLGPAEIKEKSEPTPTPLLDQIDAIDQNNAPTLGAAGEKLKT